jgi:hypothetical protein
MPEVGRVVRVEMVVVAVAVLAEIHEMISAANRQADMVVVAAQGVAVPAAATIILVILIMIHLQKQSLMVMETPAPVDQQAQREVPGLLVTRVHPLQPYLSLCPAVLGAMGPLAAMAVLGVTAVTAALVEQAPVRVSLRLLQVMVVRPVVATPNVVVLTALGAAALAQSMMDVMAVLAVILILYRGVIAVAAMVVVIAPREHLTLP